MNELVEFQVFPTQAKPKAYLKPIVEIRNKRTGIIYGATEDTHIKAVVNSVFDTASVEETLVELKSINGGLQRRTNALGFQ